VAHDPKGGNDREGRSPDRKGRHACIGQGKATEERQRGAGRGAHEIVESEQSIAGLAARAEESSAMFRLIGSLGAAGLVVWFAMGTDARVHWSNCKIHFLPDGRDQSANRGPRLGDP
jgi:hypothetical protein